MPSAGPRATKKFVNASLPTKEMDTPVIDVRYQKLKLISMTRPFKNVFWTPLAKQPDPEPECRIDEDCPRDHACIGASCQNPCTLNNPCSRSQRCVVENTLPVRTVACVCPNGFVQGTGGDCVKVTATPECYRNEDCRTPEVCHTGSCLDACLVYDCAPDAICSTTVHDIECTCRPGFTGDGRSYCSRGKLALNSLLLF